LVFVAALLLVLAGAPTAAAPAGAAASHVAAPAASSPTRHAPDRDSAALAKVPTIERFVVATSAPSRRLGAGGAKLKALRPCLRRVLDRSGAGIDREAGARLLRASNTPCCVRGPPASA
jgi:hypothetical protein